MADGNPMGSAMLTHKGWLGICPIYVGGIAGDEPLVVERWRILAPLLWLSTEFFGLCFVLRGIIDPEYEPGWPIRITGELRASSR